MKNSRICDKTLNWQFFDGLYAPARLNALKPVQTQVSFPKRWQNMSKSEPLLPERHGNAVH